MANNDLLVEEIKKLKKVKINADPARPTHSYIGYILHEDRKFLKIHEGLMQSLTKGVKSIGAGYRKLQRGADKLKQFSSGDIGVLQDIGSENTTYSERQVSSIGVNPSQILRLKTGVLPYVTVTDNLGVQFIVSFKDNRFLLVREEDYKVG